MDRKGAEEIFRLRYDEGHTAMECAELAGVHYNTALAVLSRKHAMSRDLPRHKNEPAT